MDSDVQKVKDRLNITDVIGQYVQLRRAGRTYIGRCPFHKERTPSFHVSPERGTFKCFGCGEGGDVFTFIEKIDGVDFKTALKQLAEKAGVTLDQSSYAPKDPGVKEYEERLREVCESATQFFELELRRRKDVSDYLHTRGLLEATATHWRLGYAPASWDTLSLHLQKLGYSAEEIVDAGFAVKSEKRPGRIFDRFRGRIMFPIFDIAGRPIAVSGRYFEQVPGMKETGEPAKYVNSPETAVFKKSRTLYGLDRARVAIRRADCILLVEGQFDLLMAHQTGLPFAVALSGTALTPEHLSLLGRLSKRLVLALDADQAGIRAGLKSAQLAINGGFEVKVPTFGAGQDPADVAKENPELLKAAIRTSRSAIEFFLDALRPNARDERAYATLVQQQILPLIAAMQSVVDQEHFAALVANRLGVSQAAVMTEVHKKPVSAAPSSDTHVKESQSTLTPVQKKAGMLMARFGPDSDIGRKLREILGENRFGELWQGLEPRAEELRFLFDQEVGESEESLIAEEILQGVAPALKYERSKMKFV
ncbi:DNA primase [Candidatus Nomurabacteria bacterium]|nr:DNA primase [Candidatus Nomurabacteria bacterium]